MWALQLLGPYPGPPLTSRVWAGTCFFATPNYTDVMYSAPLWFNNLGPATVQLWYRATVASNHWIHLNGWGPLASNGWIQLWYDTTVAPQVFPNN